MDEALKKLMLELDKSLKALNESVAAKFSSADPKAVDDEKNKLVDRVLELEKTIKTLERQKAVKKMVWEVTGKSSEEGATQVPFNRFLKAVLNKDMGFIEEMKAASGQSEGTAADGGIAIPVEYANLIIALERQSSIVRQVARIVPMGSLTRKIPRELAKPSVYWTSEGTEPTALSKGTLEQITQTAKKLLAIVPFTEELLEDTNVNYDSFIAEIIATEMGREEDKQAFVGDVSGVTDPFNGVFFATGVNAVTAAGLVPDYDDMVNLFMSIRAPYRARSQFVLSTTALKLAMKMIDDQSRPIWSMPEAGAPGRLMGRPYFETDQIPDTLGTTRTNGSNTAILLGAWDGLWVSPRGGYTIKASDSASNAAGKSAFALDETWFKFRRRESIDVVNPEAFGKLTLAAS